ncbi:MAG: ACP S-malonyltransferase [Coriobacteriia bacterium]
MPNAQCARSPKWLDPRHMRTHAVVFPGQGSQRAGMLDAVPETDSFERLLDAAEALSGLPLRQIAAGGPADLLADTRAAQPLLYLCDWAWGVTLLSEGIDPVALAGHSLGEYAALAVAGVVSPEAGLELVIERSRLMAIAAKATPGGMAAVLGMDNDAVIALVDPLDNVWVANDNAPGQIVVSGTHPGIETATAALSAAGARRIVPLPVAGGFHSPLMASARDAFADILAQTDMRDAAYPIYQNTAPSPATAADTIKTRLIDQIVSPVRWTETMAALTADGVEVLVEAGPGAVLAGLARRFDGLNGVDVESGGLPRVLEVLNS